MSNPGEHAEPVADVPAPARFRSPWTWWGVTAGAVGISGSVIFLWDKGESGAGSVRTLVLAAIVWVALLGRGGRRTVVGAPIALAIALYDIDVRTLWLIIFSIH